MLSLPRAGEYACILADPPWRYEVWSGKGTARSADNHYSTMKAADIAALPVSEIAAPDCVLFIWVTWPTLLQAIELISAWGFAYKTCAFDWMKAHAGQIDMFRDDADALMGMGYWTRANSEPCLLATRGKPKRLSKGVRQGIIEPRREHSRKPDCAHGRIEQLVPGPYLELFSRQARPGWDSWGNEVDKFAPLKAAK